MSDYRFSADDHRLNVYKSAFDGFCGHDFDEAAWVEIDNNMFVRERTCRIEEVDLDGNPVGGTVFGDGFCSQCWGIVEVEDKFCRHCGARMEADRGW